MLYCELYGFSCDFGYFKAIEFIGDNDFYVKRMAYLFISICFPRDIDILTLALNQINQDLQKINNVPALICGTTVCNHITSLSDISLFKESVTILCLHGEYFILFLVFLLEKKLQ